MAHKPFIDIPALVAGMRQISYEKEQIKDVLKYSAPYLLDYISRHIRKTGQQKFADTEFLKFKDDEQNVLGCVVEAEDYNHFVFRLYFHTAYSTGRVLIWGATTEVWPSNADKISVASEGLKGNETIPCIALLERFMEKLSEPSPRTFEKDLNVFYKAAQRAKA